MTVVQRSPEAGIQWSGGALYSEASAPSVNLPGEATNTLPSTPSGRPPQPTVMPAEGDVCVTPPVGDSVAEMASIPSGEPPFPPARERWIPACAGMTVVQRSPEAGIQWSGGALLSGGIHTLRRPPWRGIHILPSTPSGRPPQPTVMPAEGDLCVTPPVGDSVAEMASIPSGEPPNVDSRLRGNDGCAKVSGSGHPVVWRGTPTREASTPSIDLPGEASIFCRQPLRGGRHSLPSCPRKETFA